MRNSSAINQRDMSGANLFTVRQFVEAHPWCTAGTLRAQIFFQDSNGLKEAGAILKMGRRKILIDRDRYLSWLYEQNGQA